jgi:hypothetical protein
MPVASVARQPRGLQTEDGADASRAEHGDEALEAGSLDGSARRAAEVVVDHVNLAEAALTGEIHERVLPPLALHVFLDLGQRRLPHVDDGLASEQGRR